MGFFKDFKDDFSQAVNELMPGEDNLETTASEDNLVVNTLEGEVDVASELSKLDGLLQQVTQQEAEKAAAARKAAAEAKVKAAQADEKKENVTADSNTTDNVTKATQEEKKMADNMTTYQTTPAAQAPAAKPEVEVADETSLITQGTVIKGDIVSNGSLDIQGQVDGNVGCNGKLVVTGVINGNSNSSEFFADAAKIEGEVVSTGTVKIGLGSVVIGNVTSTSAVIAGAIKGDIDVQGPVVVDTSAVVMGNIKSRSVQINNGAVIEGFCSQSYSDVDVQSLFGEKKGM